MLHDQILKPGLNTITITPTTGSIGVKIQTLNYTSQLQSQFKVTNITFNNATFAPQVTNATDYYAFGAPMLGRQFSSLSYRYGFNGKENDNEVKGEGNNIHFEFREYDCRIGKFFSIDPKTKDYAWQSPFAYHRNSPINHVDYLGLGDPSTDVKENKDGSYTVVNAKNDGDNNIYVVDDKGNRIKQNNADGTQSFKTIGKTLTPFDFMQTDDKNGTFVFDPKPIEVQPMTFRMDELQLHGKSYPQINIEKFMRTNGENLVYDMHEYYEKQVGLLNLLSLKQLSVNGGPLDIKAHMGHYTPILYKTSAEGVKYITTMRAIGNIAFGLNLRATAGSVLPTEFYQASMAFVGSYNQKQNNGIGYNSGWPFYGEHTYSGTFIFFGYFSKLPPK